MRRKKENTVTYNILYDVHIRSMWWKNEKLYQNLDRTARKCSYS